MRLMAALLMARRVVCFFLILQFIPVYTEFSRNPCFEFEDCKSCVSHPLCVWVLQMQHYLTSPLTKGGKRHCVLRKSTTQLNSRHFHDPKPTVNPEGKLSYYGFEFYPHTSSLFAKPDAELQFHMSVKPVTLTHLDIYFLVHRSMPVEGILTIISNKLVEIVAELKITFTKVKIGIGKFGDIPVYPFAASPTASFAETSEYVFQNLGMIADDIETIQDILILKTTSESLQPKYVFDAMLQVSECTGNINWTRGNDVLRLMIVVTDSGSKRVGHGNIIGLFQPNNGVCKMGRSSFVRYHSTDYIHPHVLGVSLSEKNIKVLFLTQESLVGHYTVLTESFKHQVVGIKDYGKITDTSVIETIKLATNQNRQINFNIDHLKNIFDVKYKIQCSPSEDSTAGKLLCEEVPPGQMVKLYVTIKFSPKRYSENKISSYVKVNSFYKATVDIKFDWICPCQAQSRGATRQTKCSSHGQLICGKCDCDQGWEGDTCQCQKGASTGSSDDAECTSNEECGHSGKCICNKCQCPESPEQFYGAGCVCSDLTCPYTQKGLCNGQGTCKCGTCKCNEGFTEADCSGIRCENNLIKKKCKRTEESEVCSKKGNCHCGNCECDPGYSGSFCEKMTIPTVRCSDIEECMKSAYSSPENTACQKPLTIVEKLEEPTTFLKLICLAVYQGCLREFMIHANDKGTSIEAITLRKLNIEHDCAHNSNFTKILLISMAITSAATIAFYGFGYGIYLVWKKKKQERVKNIRRLQRYILQQRQVYEDTPGFAE